LLYEKKSDIRLKAHVNSNGHWKGARGN